MGDSDEDDLCNDLLDHLERQHAFQTNLLQQSGGALDGAQGAFEFELDPYVDRLSSRMGVRERHFKTRLRQRGNLIDNENITQALQDGLRRAVNQVLATTPNLHDQDRVYFTLGSDRLHNNFQGWGLRAGEWREGGERLDALFDRLAQALNSNEQFEMDDSFQLSITQVHHAPQGRGKPRRGKPGHPTMQMLTKTSKSVIRIQNDNEVCCARALVTAKARVDQHPKWHSIRRGSQLQRTLALELHHEATVPLGPCSYDALTKFSAAPSLTNYQIILVDAHRSFHITTFGGTQDKQLILLHNQGHYDVITRLPGFFGSSYVCVHCWKPYDHEDHHRCNKRKQCGACRQKECPYFMAAYPRGLKATQRCQQCHRDFFGETCFQTHLAVDHTGKPATNPQTTVCFRRRRCPDCFKQEVGPQALERHQCDYLDCPSYHEYVDGKTHRCFIQRAPTPQEQKKKRKRKRQGGPRAKRGAAAGLQTTNEADPEEEDVDDDMPPLHVFFDIEAMQPHEQHIANCLRDFLEWLDTLTLNDTRQVNVLAHNFQGYDGYFVIHQYYSDNRIVEQLRNGCKLLEVQHDRIRFIDSLSFFQMPLSAFLKTFGLTALRKGYFPHMFNRPEHQTYVGLLPALDYYMPETMAAKARQALETWHQEQRAQNVVFDFQKELVAYCESDVRLLKEGCLTFKRLFETLAGFNPFEHITIASACNRDLRMNQMIPNSIASEPVRGWRNKINQSGVALEWLTWCDHQQRQQALETLTPDDLEQHDIMANAYPDHPHPSHRQYVQHVHNAGEVHIPTVGFMDGYCPDTKIVYEFQGCFTHGCPTCYPNVTKNMCATMIGPCKMSPRPRNKNSKSFEGKGTTWWKCGGANGPASKTPRPTSARSWRISPSSSHLTHVMPSAGVVPMPSNSTIMSPPVKRSITSMSPPCTLGSTKPVCTPKGILDSFPNRVTRTSAPTLVSSNAKSCLRVTCTIPYCLTAMKRNSFFPSVPLVSKNKCPNAHGRDRWNAATPTSNASSPGRGAAPNFTKPSSWGTRSNTSTRCGILTRPAKDCSETTSTLG